MSQSTLDQATQYHQHGQLKEALGLYEQVLAMTPNEPAALDGVGLILQQLGKHDRAIVYISQALENNSQNAAYWNHLGSSLLALGSVEEALQNFRTAVELDPQGFENWINLGVALTQAGELEEALQSYIQARQLNRHSPIAYTKMGIVLNAQGKTDEAIQHYKKALEKEPKAIDARFNLGTLYLKTGRGEEAIPCFEKLLLLYPDLAEPHIQLGVIYFNQGQWDESIQHYQHAMDKAPHLLLPVTELARIYTELGRTEEARVTYQHGARLAPNHPLLPLQEANVCPVITPETETRQLWYDTLDAQLNQCMATDWQLEIEELPSHGVPPSFYAMYHGTDLLPLKKAFSQLYTQHLSFSLPPLDPNLVALHPKHPNKIRLGFVVNTGHEPIFLSFMGPLLQGLDRETFDVMVFCAQRGYDTLEKALGTESTTYGFLSNSLTENVQTLQCHQLDLLYYFETGTGPMDYFLPFFRLAPVQCTSWGVPVTSGIPTLDYYVSSNLIEPEGAQAHYEEQLITLNSLPTVFEKPHLSSPLKSKKELGLPEGKHLYGCPQSLSKFHPDFDPLLKDLLEQDPNGCLILIEDRHEAITTSLQTRFQKTLSNVIHQVIWIPRIPPDLYLHLLSQLDILLDPLHFGSGKTTYEALAMGTPIVTLPGKFMRSRATQGCYRKIDMTECVATTSEAYVQLALKLGKNPAFRQHLSEAIQQRSHKLFHDEQAGAELTSFFKKAVEQTL